ncbi:MAG: cation:proton antiporter [Deltaproteobacteria bacterium]|nr:cation:proton antiporter [Deltaproteobacteria bacterium]
MLHVLTSLVAVLAVTVATVSVFHKLRLPAVIGYLAVGVVMGPHGLGVIGHGEALELLAEIGIVLLLFSIGLEFSFERFLAVKGPIITGGLLQVGLTALAVTAVGVHLGYPVRISLFFGMLASLSSTAIVLKILSDRDELSALHGRLAIGTLLLQDIIAVPMMLSVPVLGETDTVSYQVVALTLGKAILAVFLIFTASRFVVPWFMHQVARLRNQEVFVLFVLLICLGTAWAAFQTGISLALGAFIAGLLISDSEYSHQVIADIHPLRDTFAGIFFISIGMQVDVHFVSEELAVIAGALLLLVFIKGGLITAIFAVLQRSFRLGLMLGLALAQVGEFSLILARMGGAFELLSPAQEQMFLAVAILSMLATPLLILGGSRLGMALHGGAGGSEEPPEGAMAGHVIIVGYGLNGRNLARVLREVDIPHRILELDPRMARRAGAAGESIEFGDATRPAVLSGMGVERARVLVVAISDPVATSRIVAHARRLHPNLYIIVRTRYVVEIPHLTRLGANEVIPEEFETSVEIFARVLQEYHVPRNVITLQVEMVRREGYGMLRGLRLEDKSLARFNQFLTGATADTFLVQEEAPGASMTIGELKQHFQGRTSVLALVRDGVSVESPSMDYRLRPGDILVLLGSHADLDHAVQLLTAPREDESLEP